MKVKLTNTTINYEGELTIDPTFYHDNEYTICKMLEENPGFKVKSDDGMGLKLTFKTNLLWDNDYELAIIAIFTENMFKNDFSFEYKHQDIRREEVILKPYTIFLFSLINNLRQNPFEVKLKGYLSDVPSRETYMEYKFYPRFRLIRPNHISYTAAGLNAEHDDFDTFKRFYLRGKEVNDRRLLRLAKYDNYPDYFS